VSTTTYYTHLEEPRLFELAAKIKPVYRPKRGSQLRFVKPDGPNEGINLDYLRHTAYLWDPTPGPKAEGLKEIAKITTYHSYGYYGLFKPDISEILAQIPAEHLDRCVAFELVDAPEDANDLNKNQQALNDGYHVAACILYERA
jgi:hypothetical protein